MTTSCTASLKEAEREPLSDMDTTAWRMPLRATWSFTLAHEAGVTGGRRVEGVWAPYARELRARGVQSARGAEGATRQPARTNPGR